MSSFYHVGPVRRTRCKGWGYDVFDTLRGRQRYAYGSCEVANRQHDSLLNVLRRTRAGFVTYSNVRQFDSAMRTIAASPTQSVAYG